MSEKISVSTSTVVLEDYVLFGRIHVNYFTLTAGAISLIAGVGLISLSIWYNMIWGLFGSLLWTMIPISLIYGLLRGKRVFYKPFIYNCYVMGTLEFFFSIYLMVIGFFVECCPQTQEICECSYDAQISRYGGPIFAISICTFYFANVASRALWDLEQNKQRSQCDLNCN